MNLKTRGAATTDYLMIAAVVLGIGIPLIHNYFGDRVLGLFQRNRQTLVTFIAQTPVRDQGKPGKPVPRYWFKNETPARFDDPDELPAPGAIDEPTEITTGEITGGGPIEGGGKIEEPGQITVGTINPPGNIATSAGGASGDIGTSGIGGQDSSSQTTSTSGENQGRAGRDSYGRLQTAENEETGQTSGPDQAPTIASESGQKTGKQGASSDASRRANAAMERLKDDDYRKQSRFDWWVLIKILLLVLVAFILFLIALGNLKRTR